MPIGTVIAWPLASDPAGADKNKWLECDGQLINAAKYPKLAALMARVPDYRGVFLRGLGSQQSTHYGTVLHSSADLGDLQGDTIRNIYGTIAGRGAVEEGATYTGAFYRIGFGPGAGAGWSDDYFGFDASLVVPTDIEVRPINRAVRWLIRAA